MDIQQQQHLFTQYNTHIKQKNTKKKYRTHRELKTQSSATTTKKTTATSSSSFLFDYTNTTTTKTIASAHKLNNGNRALTAAVSDRIQRQQQQQTNVKFMLKFGNNACIMNDLKVLLFFFLCSALRVCVRACSHCYCC